MKIRIILLVLIQIPDQVRNDGTAVVILTNPAAGGSELFFWPLVVILTKVRICLDPASRPRRIPLWRDKFRACPEFNSGMAISA